ncbi:MAG: FAD-binding and (Fe-S)-binding domain-containing protein [Phycisphaerales bacterium]
MTESVLGKLRAHIAGDVFGDEHTRGLYSTDASIYQVMPEGVVVPASVAEAQKAVEICGAAGVAMLPRGGGTSLAGQCVNRAVVIDVSGKCDRVVSVDAGGLSCRVEAGVTVDDLNDRLACDGVFFAPDPSTARQATIGGCIGNNAAGVHSVLYGRTSENVESIGVCLWDGAVVELGMGSAFDDARVMELTRGVMDIIEPVQGLIRERYPKTLRRSAGYQLDVILEQLEAGGWDPGKVNLKDLLCGSEGTLAMTLEATLRLQRVPRLKGLAVIAYGSVEEAISVVEGMLELGPAGVELLDDLILDLARKNREQSRYVGLLPELEGRQTRAVLYVEFFGDSVEEIRDRLERVGGKAGDGAVELITDPLSMAEAWKLRKAGEPLLHGVEGARKPLGFIEDCAIPVDRLGEFVDRLRVIVQGQGTIASYYAHVSVGVLHVRPLLDLRDPADEKAMHRIASECADLAKELGGVASGEHGDGRARGPVLERFMGPELMEAHRAVKRLFDPHGLMNPGNIVSPGPIESISAQTRVRPGSTNLTIEGVDTGMRFDDEGGLGHAVEMCNGAGVCRKKMNGVMCPSYQGTLDERHSTRGRGNALRLAVTGQSKFGDEGGEAQWDDPETLATLDLCLSCKACKTECPSGVDIAKLKSEYLWQGYRKNGVPWKARVISNVHLLNRLGSVMPSVSNAMSAWSPIRSVLNHVMGLHPDRSLPMFARGIRSVPFGSGQARDRKRVLLVSDSMTTYTEPRIVGAAVRVLERLGYEVGVVTTSDLGRSAISQGNLGAAKEDGARSLSRIRSFAGDAEIEGVLFVEPSAMSVVTDEWKDLLDEGFMYTHEWLVERAQLVEDFVGSRWSEHPQQIELRSADHEIKVHTHCHQKALWGSGTTMGVFDRICPGSAELIDAGCCGMAGAFGFMESKFELSNRIGEQRLMPAIRGRGEGAWVVAGGTSCRHQILDATGVHAIHPIEAVDRLMNSD